MSAVWLLAFFVGIFAAAQALADGYPLAALGLFAMALACGPLWLKAMRSTR